MKNKQTIIDALRCSATAGGDCKLEECPYFCLEEINLHFNIPADFVKDGKEYWSSCDVDRIALDAAELLEANDDQN